MKGLRVGGLLEPKKPGYSALFVALGSEERGLGLDDLWELLVLCEDAAWSRIFAAPLPAGATFKAQAWWLEEHLRRWEGA